MKIQNTLIGLFVIFCGWPHNSIAADKNELKLKNIVETINKHINVYNNNQSALPIIFHDSAISQVTFNKNHIDEYELAFSKYITNVSVKDTDIIIYTDNGMVDIYDTKGNTPRTRNAYWTCNLLFSRKQCKNGGGPETYWILNTKNLMILTLPNSSREERENLANLIQQYAIANNAKMSDRFNASANNMWQMQTRCINKAIQNFNNSTRDINQRSDREVNEKCAGMSMTEALKCRERIKASYSEFDKYNKIFRKEEQICRTKYTSKEIENGKQCIANLKRNYSRIKKKWMTNFFQERDSRCNRYSNKRLFLTCAKRIHKRYPFNKLLRQAKIERSDCRKRYGIK